MNVSLALILTMQPLAQAQTMVGRAGTMTSVPALGLPALNSAPALGAPSLAVPNLMSLTPSLAPALTPSLSAIMAVPAAARVVAPAAAKTMDPIKAVTPEPARALPVLQSAAATPEAPDNSARAFDGESEIGRAHV